MCVQADALVVVLRTAQLQVPRRLQAGRRLQQIVEALVPGQPPVGDDQAGLRATLQRQERAGAPWRSGR